jgi:hypothetical protein
MELLNLPITATNWHLNEIPSELRAKHRRVPISRSQKRVPLCCISFSSEDALFCAKKLRLKYQGHELLWSVPSEKYVNDVCCPNIITRAAGNI